MGSAFKKKNHQIKYASSHATWYRVVFKAINLHLYHTEGSENLHSNLVVSDISPIIGSMESHRDDITGCDVVVLIIRALAWLRDVWWELELLNVESANCLKPSVDLDIKRRTFSFWSKCSMFWNTCCEIACSFSYWVTSSHSSNEKPQVSLVGHWKLYALATCSGYLPKTGSVQLDVFAESPSIFA